MKKPSKKTSKKIKLTDPKFNQEPPTGSVVLNFEAGTTVPEQIEKVTSKIMPIKSEEPDEQTAATRAAPESAPTARNEFSLNVFLRENLEAKEGEKKLTTLDIVDKYTAAAVAAGEPALPKFQVQRMLRSLVFKHFPAAVYSNSTPNGFKGVIWKSLPE